MTTKKESHVFRTAIDRWGSEMQVKMMLEEMSELSIALLKFGRAKENHADEQEQMIARYENVLEEMADVQIMLDQMVMLFGGNGLRLAEIRKQKIERLATKLMV